VQLPDSARRIIEERAEASGFRNLERAAQAMSDAYRAGQSLQVGDEERTAAYLVTRMPATYAASLAALREVAGSIGSVLDVGAGTGGASLAARGLFPGAAITMIERDAAFAAAAQQFLPEARIIPANAVTMQSLPEHDLVVAAYSLGEMGERMVHPLWRAARVALAVIEPGTPKGYTLVLRTRDELLARGARMAAPCPAETPCPIVPPDWCHFAARVERSSLHRRLKHAELGYEDEKFSYVVLSRGAADAAQARIVQRPRQTPGLVTLELCTPDGLQTQRVTKRDREAFRAARHSAWGDRWGRLS
jgi:ribosomal protein RSM22 (predicted rRNA methylase)